MQSATPRPKRTLVTVGILAAILCAFVSATRLAAQLPPRMPGGGLPGGPPAKRNIAFASNGTRWAWLTRDGDAFILSAGAPDTVGKEIARGKDWNSVAVETDAIWIAESRGESGALLRVKEGGAPQEAVRCSGKPSGFFQHFGQLYWAEREVRAPSTRSFVPTLADQIVARVRRSDGSVRNLGAWPAGIESEKEWHLPAVIGVADDAVYLKVPRPYSTEFIRIPADGGAPTRLAIETEVQQGLPFRGAFVWTAPSLEAVPAFAMRRVCRLSRDKVETFAEWLEPDGALIAHGDTLFYAADEFYRIPEKLAVPEHLGNADVSLAAADANGIILVNPYRGGPPRLFKGN